VVIKAGKRQAARIPIWNFCRRLPPDFNTWRSCSAWADDFWTGVFCRLSASGGNGGFRRWFGGKDLQILSRDCVSIRVAIKLLHIHPKKPINLRINEELFLHPPTG
jgi:hypothetical protein